MGNKTKTRNISPNSKKNGSSPTKPPLESKGNTPESENGTPSVPMLYVEKAKLEKLIQKNEDLKK